MTSHALSVAGHSIWTEPGGEDSNQKEEAELYFVKHGGPLTAHGPLAAELAGRSTLCNIGILDSSINITIGLSGRSNTTAIQKGMKAIETPQVIS